MTQAEYDQIRAELHALAEGIQTAKRPGYTQGNTDVLKNFKGVGERVQSLCPACGTGHPIGEGAAWAVYFLKHVDAILSIVTRPDLPVSEAAPGRFADGQNYLDLGFGIVAEREDNKALRAEVAAGLAALEVGVLEGGV